ncbi:hypothetical protein YC2023_032230 [Brassica napus]
MEFIQFILEPIILLLSANQTLSAFFSFTLAQVEIRDKTHQPNNQLCSLRAVVTWRIHGIIKILNAYNRSSVSNIQHASTGQIERQSEQISL